MTDALSSPLQSRTIIEQFFAAIPVQGLDEALTAYVASDATFIGVKEERQDDVPIYGSYEGHEGAKQFFSILRSLFDTQVFEFHHALEQGDVSMATGFFHHRIKETGKDFFSHWACLCTLKDGKIATYRFYEDTAALEFSLRAEH